MIKVFGVKVIFISNRAKENENSESYFTLDELKPDLSKHVTPL